MADTASTLNFGPQWLHKQFSVPDANGGGGGHGGGGTGPAAFHVGRSGDHRGGGGKILAGYVIMDDAQIGKCHGHVTIENLRGPHHYEL